MIRLHWVRDKGLGRHGKAGVIAAAIAVAVFATAVALLYLQVSGRSSYDLVIVFGINAVLVVGLQVLVGNTGVMSFGQMAFVSIGAYTAGILAVSPSRKEALLPHLPALLRDRTLPVVPTLIVAGLAAAVVALLIGPALMRLTGIAAGITTLGLLVIMNGLIRNAKDYTRGNETFFGVPRSATLPVVFGTLTVVVALAAVVKWSQLGLRARAVREDPLAAETSGIRVLTSRLWPWVISAGISGAGGALLAYQLTAFSPNSFYLTQTIPIVIMVIVGGVNSVTGAIVGTTLLTVWQEFVRDVESGNIGPLHFLSINGIAELSLGLGLVLVLLTRPTGAMGSREPQLSVGRRNGHRTPLTDARDQPPIVGTVTDQRIDEATIVTQRTGEPSGVTDPR
jgi:branched-chain amino acid transport system permease protein